jgi:hypothetical protein
VEFKSLRAADSHCPKGAGAGGLADGKVTVQIHSQLDPNAESQRGSSKPALVPVPGDVGRSLYGFKAVRAGETLSSA